MAEDVIEERKPMEAYQPGEKLVAQAGNSDYDDYVKVEPGEAIEAHITAVKKGEKTYLGETQDKMFVYAQLDEGPGKNQTYRGDFNPKLTTTDSPKQSNLSKFLKTLGLPSNELDPASLVGLPVRVELSDPWGEKGLQFVNVWKKPAPSQKRVEPDHVLSADEVAEALGGEVVEDE